MNVISLESRIVDRLNRLPPHSRLRPGYVDLMRQIKREQLGEERLHRVLVRALEDELRVALEAM
jgi:hypothetical protein